MKTRKRNTVKVRRSVLSTGQVVYRDAAGRFVSAPSRKRAR